MKCILHIGTEKTGSTAIQKWLHVNRHALLRSGYLYTESTGSTNNRALPVAAYDLSRRDEFTRRIGLHSDELLRQFQTNVLRHLAEEIRGAREENGISVVLFSSEHIHSRLVTDTEVARLKHVLGNLGFDDFRVIVYLRNPVDAAASLYSTAIRYGRTDRHAHPPDDPYYQNLCDHRGTLLRYVTHFGAAHVTPRLYIPAQFVRGSLLRDFSEAAGYDIYSVARQVPGLVNESMSSSALRVMRVLNHMGSPAKGRVRSRLQRPLCRLISTLFRDGPAYALTPDLSERYAAYFAESNEWVRQRFFPERPTLF